MQNNLKKNKKKKVIVNANPILTMEDFYTSSTEPTTPSKRFESSNFFSEEFNRELTANTPGKKQTHQKEPEPLPTLTPPPFLKSSFLFQLLIIIS